MTPPRLFHCTRCDSALFHAWTEDLELFVVCWSCSAEYIFIEIGQVPSLQLVREPGQEIIPPKDFEQNPKQSKEAGNRPAPTPSKPN